ncbi:DNA helicase PcrA [Roseburia sp. AF22-2LB]|jgi:DNA helicase-2/ATP-dependent DNA helicase PcrA|uniref:DNA helicase PcrA n=1 Tax=unclassified Roseburia TaxID=2637578 RepID=UPI000E51A153|nr:MULTISPECIES: DNA helicase PcrA [unclassified Roseburia]RGG35152.1 DNA helicase PcrA [Roseburia sp. AF22-8AC]RGG39902.1 DNA helicase PcrA [Roseburia sp. AF22-2LB]
MSIYDSLNEEQKKGVFTTEGPVLLLAGAGSGKTRVLTHRAVYLIEELGVNPYHILAITFTNKAAGEMRERIDDMVGYGSENIWVSTFHSTCVRILRRFIDHIGFGTNFTIYDTEDQKTIMKDICKRLEIDTKMYKEKSLLAAISSAKDELISPEAYALRAQGDFRKMKEAAVYREYQQVLRKNNALDFDDLIVKTVELFQSDMEVLDYYQERFRYIMVDEYQDTNTAQFQLIKLLAGKYKNLCVVGDDDQSIYKFRGANIYNILNFEKEFPNAVTIKLEQNYRSTQNILNAANGVIANNVGRKAKRLWTENEEGEKIAFHQFETGFDEADYVAKDIRSKVREGLYHYGDCAVLYRTNAQSRLFEERFITASIPYKIVGGVNFYSRREIKDLLAYLKTIDNAMDDLAVRRIINVPKRGIGATTLSRVQDYADENGLTFYNALKMAEEIGTIGRASAKIRPFVMLIQSMRSKLPYISVSELLQEIIEETGYVRELEAENTEEAQQRMENIDELISKAVTYEESEEEPTLSGFLEEVALVADIDSVDETQDYVVLMTLHSAKGLEFPQVYLAGMEDGLFPGFGAICAENPTAEIEEERRLAYVGITRAKERLSISCARMRMIRGETQYNKVSRFVKEIPRELLAGTIQKEKMPDIPKPSMMAKNAFSAKPMALRRTGVPEARNFGNSTMKKPLDYAVGDTVSHMKFGTGVVKQIIDGGRDYEVTVDFSGVGVKKMFASFAKLKKL